ncbi:hypothetical protein ColTof3_08644 [Colletotrichum tofieldiae]|nr:hypothetical protein ColTof3_08644 [Colletotrichum tofieldiae]
MERERETRSSRRLALAARGDFDSSAPSGAAASADSPTREETASYPESPTPTRPIRTIRLPPFPQGQMANDAAGSQRSNNPLLPTRSLSFPRSATSASSSASAYADAISYRPHPTKTTTTMMTVPSLPPSDAGSSRRSRSPVKGMGSLGFAERPVQVVTLKSPAQIPVDIKTLCDEVGRIKMGAAVVPATIRQEVDDKIAAIRMFDPPVEDKNLDTTPSTRSRYGLLFEMEALTWIVRDTESAIEQNLSEAHWNDRVHSQLLATAIERDVADAGERPPGDSDSSSKEACCSVRVFNATQATISAACVPRHATEGLDLEAKMVDYCIGIRDREIERAARNAVRSQPVRHAAAAGSSSSAASSSAASASGASDTWSSPGRRNTRKTKKPAALPQSINHTEYDPLRQAPISVSIETKKPGGSEDAAKAQLSVWASAQILRLRQLLGGSEDPVGITLPLLFVSGPTWQLLFAVEKDDCIELLHSLSFRFDEGSNTLIGCYQILALLRALRRWSQTVFRDWFLTAFAEV